YCLTSILEAFITYLLLMLDALRQADTIRCKETSLQYTLRRSFKNIDSQHFWDQMDCRLYHVFLPEGNVPKNARVFWIS
ncbi:MAG: hypothetical protein COS89_01645, partial [Deltaproteobacteria bacterium CG07_land_8_20_14_0_80_38_7]